MNAMFAEYLGKIMEIYVDDMLVKSLTTEEHVGHLKIFEVILRRGIEANPEKIQAILDMETPKERNQVQSLAWKIFAEIIVTVKFQTRMSVTEIIPIVKFQTRASVTEIIPTLKFQSRVSVTEIIPIYSEVPTTQLTTTEVMPLMKFK
ncbi:hypothetical protein ACLB2K_030602 [Fragaria x ananassa]